MAVVLNNLAELYTHRKRYSEAEPLLGRALTIKKKALGQDHPSVAIAMQSYAYLLRKMKLKAEAVALEREANLILARCSPNCVTPQVVNVGTLTHAGSP